MKTSPIKWAKIKKITSDSKATLFLLYHTKTYLEKQNKTKWFFQSCVQIQKNKEGLCNPEENVGWMTIL